MGVGRSEQVESLEELAVPNPGGDVPASFGQPEAILAGSIVVTKCRTTMLAIHFSAMRRSTRQRRREPGSRTTPGPPSGSADGANDRWMPGLYACIASSHPRDPPSVIRGDLRKRAWAGELKKSCASSNNLAPSRSSMSIRTSATSFAATSRRCSST